MATKNSTQETGGGSTGRKTQPKTNTSTNTTNILLPPYPVQPTEFKTEGNLNTGLTRKLVGEVDGNTFPKL